MDKIATKDIALALKYCISDSGEFCDVCPYAKFGPICSKHLLRDASNRLRELDSEH